MSSKSDHTIYKVGELARAASVGVETIRYYERQGLLPEPLRRSAVHHRGYRTYDAEDLRRLRFIVRAKELGFTLKEVAALLALRAEGPAVCESVHEQATRHLKDVEARLRDLERIRRALKRLIGQCAAHESGAACPILDFLDQEEP